MRTLFSVSLAFVWFAATLTAEPVEFFSDTFDNDSSADWTVIPGAPAGGDWAVVFAYDYSADGIPSAPNSPDGQTRGVKISLNHFSGDTYSVNLLPSGQHFSGDYVLKLDLWINYPGPLATGGPGSTEFAGFGIGASAGPPRLFGNPGGEGAWFAVNGEGGNGLDYRAYKGDALEHPSSGQYAAGTGSSARNTSNGYYHSTFPGGASAPALQQSLHPSQTGTTNAGTVGFGWREVEIRKIGDTVSWSIDGLPIATLDPSRGSGSVETEGNIVLSYLDHNSSISDADVAFGLFDNVRVYEIPPQPTAGNISLAGHAEPFGQQYGGVGGDGDIAVTGTFLNNVDNGVGIFDISDPANPVLASDYNPLPGQTRFEDVWVRDGIGYFGCWRLSSGGGTNGVHIVDLSDPYNPVKIAAIDPSINGHPQVHTLFLDGAYLYTAAHRPTTSGRTVKVFDISDPYNPAFVRDILTTDTDKVHQITVRNGRLFTSGWGGHTDIFDVSDVANAAPRLGTIYSGTNSHSSWPTEDGNVLVSCRETPGGDVRFYDISDPANPELILLLDHEMVGIDDFIPHNPVVVGDLLFVSWYENGLQIFDITDPALPVRVGFFETGGRGLSWDGNWGVYPLLGLDRVLLSDMSEGLFIVDATAVLTKTENYPPLIVDMPEPLEIGEGSDATFSATVTGSAPFSYQWLRNGQPIPGATEAELILPEIDLDDGGNYSVVVNNAAGEITSRAASLAVIPAGETVPPQIHSQPASQVVSPGQVVEFSVTASGTPQLRYQWSFEGEEIAGAESSALTVGPVLLTDAGGYSVRVWNGAGEVTSETALLEVDDSGFFYDLRVSAGIGGAVVSWKTQESATGVVEYGLPHHGEASSSSSVIRPMHAEFDFTAPTASRLSTTHSVYLAGLSPETMYSFRMIGYAGGLRYESPEFLFQTESDEKGGEAGLPAWWVEHYFDEPVDHDVDTDGDGWSVWAEYLAGTSPTEAGSRPVFSMERSGTQINLAYWPVYPGRTYTLESSDNPGQGWVAQPAASATTDEGVREFAVTDLPSGRAFFRIVVDLVELPPES